MPQSPTARKRRVSYTAEVDALEAWKKKTTGVTSYDWDGRRLVIIGPHGRETFDASTVRAVIFTIYKQI